VFSYGKGVIHTYYTVALAPAIAALVALGAYELWRERAHLSVRIAAAGGVLLTAGWAWTLLDRTPSWNPVLRWLIALTAVVAAGALVGAPVLLRRGRWAGLLLAGLVGVATLTGPVAYAADTIVTPHSGSIPSAGPASAQGAAGAGFPGGGSAGSGAGSPAGSSARGHGPAGSGSASGGAAPRGAGGEGSPSGSSRPSGATGNKGLRGTPPSSKASSGPANTETRGGSAGGAIAGGGGRGATSASAALVRALESDASHFKWVAAIEGSQNAATLELATAGDPVMAIGGFNGEGGNLSLSAFKVYVEKGEIHYYIAGSSGGGPRGSSSAIADWVAAHYSAKTIGGETVYDLTSSTSSTSSTSRTSSTSSAS
jgi:hypothetical protein